MFTDNSSPDEIDDETFSKLSTSSSYEISGSKVIVDIKGNDDFEFNLDYIHFIYYNLIYLIKKIQEIVSFLL